MMNATVCLVGLVVSLIVLGCVLWQWRKQQAQLCKNYALATLKLRKLPASSPTRRRVALANSEFTKGWKALKSKDPYACLAHFATAVEIDELGCLWKQKFESKMEQVGDFFTLPPKDDADKYQSMLAEAYLVVLLYTVLSSYGKQEGELEEDYRVVKTRLDVCVNLQPSNPAVYKLRADLVQRFGHLASRQELIADFRQAVKLLEADPDGTSLQVRGADAKEQRAFLLAYCSHQLGSLLHRSKDLNGAYAAYEAAVQHADPHFVNLADSHFSLAILTTMLAHNIQKTDKPGLLVKATQHYKAGLQAEKHAKLYLPFVNTDVSRPLAKELIKKLAKQRVQ